MLIPFILAIIIIFQIVFGIRAIANFNDDLRFWRFLAWSLIMGTLVQIIAQTAQALA